MFNYLKTKFPSSTPMFNNSDDLVGDFGARAGFTKRVNNSLTIYSKELQTLDEYFITSQAFLEYIIAKGENTDIDEEFNTKFDEMGNIYTQYNNPNFKSLEKEFTGYNNKEDIDLLQDIENFDTIENILKQIATIQKALRAVELIATVLLEKQNYDFAEGDKYRDDLLAIPIIQRIYDIGQQYSAGGRPKKSRRQKSKRRQLSKRRSSNRRSKK